MCAPFPGDRLPTFCHRAWCGCAPTSPQGPGGMGSTGSVCVRLDWGLFRCGRRARPSRCGWQAVPLRVREALSAPATGCWWGPCLSCGRGADAAVRREGAPPPGPLPAKALLWGPLRRRRGGAARRSPPSLSSCFWGDREPVGWAPAARARVSLPRDGRRPPVLERGSGFGAGNDGSREEGHQAPEQVRLHGDPQTLRGQGRGPEGPAPGGEAGQAARGTVWLGPPGGGRLLARGWPHAGAEHTTPPLLRGQPSAGILLDKPPEGVARGL